MAKESDSFFEEDAEELKNLLSPIPESDLEENNNQSDWDTEDELPLAKFFPIPESDLEENNNQSDWDTEDELPLAKFFDKPKKKSKKQKRRVKWTSTKARKIRPIYSWKGQLPPSAETISSPMRYFRQLVEQSNLYPLQRDITRPLSLCVEELERFIVITFYMSIYGLLFKEILLGLFRFALRNWKDL
ncbi:hypothetical protein QE152_g8448 [Popillia japonica]|uniref:PiggyBac transposable element-derived protein domain-containing protein n=1 Tax=Popillia japonica TaxID=7064 RepID=A0AAW1M3E6_POPJA